MNLSSGSRVICGRSWETSEADNFSISVWILSKMSGDNMGMRGHVQQKFLNDMIDSTGKIDSLQH